MNRSVLTGFKTRGEAKSFDDTILMIHSWVFRTASKSLIYNDDQLNLALLLRLEVILVKILDVKFSPVFIRNKDTC